MLMVFELSQYTIDIGPTTSRKELAVGREEPKHQFSEASVSKGDPVGHG
jgi:hypothetical protein